MRCPGTSAPCPEAFTFPVSSETRRKAPLAGRSAVKVVPITVAVSASMVTVKGFSGDAFTSKYALPCKVPPACHRRSASSWGQRLRGAVRQGEGFYFACGGGQRDPLGRLRPEEPGCRKYRRARDGGGCCQIWPDATGTAGRMRFDVLPHRIVEAFFLRGVREGESLDVASWSSQWCSRRSS